MLFTAAGRRFADELAEYYRRVSWLRMSTGDDMEEEEDDDELLPGDDANLEPDDEFDEDDFDDDFDEDFEEDFEELDLPEDGDEAENGEVDADSD